MKAGDLVYNNLFGIGEILNDRIVYKPFCFSYPRVVHKKFVNKLINYVKLTDKDLMDAYENNLITKCPAAKVIEIITGIKGFAFIPNQPSSFLHDDEVMFYYQVDSNIKRKTIEIYNLQLDNKSAAQITDKKDKNFSVGDNVYYSKGSIGNVGILEDYSIFVRGKNGQIYFFKELDKYRLQSLDEACLKKQIKASDFKVGDLLTYEGKQARVESNNIEGMNNYIILKFTKTKVKEIKIVHILELDK